METIKNILAYVCSTMLGLVGITAIFAFLMFGGPDRTETEETQMEAFQDRQEERAKEAVPSDWYLYDDEEPNQGLPDEALDSSSAAADTTATSPEREFPDHNN